MVYPLVTMCRPGQLLTPDHLRLLSSMAARQPAVEDALSQTHRPMDEAGLWAIDSAPGRVRRMLVMGPSLKNRNHPMACNLHASMSRRMASMLTSSGMYHPSPLPCSKGLSLNSDLLASSSSSPAAAMRAQTTLSCEWGLLRDQCPVPWPLCGLRSLSLIHI